MKFSFWPMPTQAYSEMRSLALHVEKTGWDGFWLADHFMPNAENTQVPWPEAWTTLAALGASVPRIRFGTLVTGNTYRHPAVLAKMAATTDHITQGRLVLGLGSGWQENEHEKYGIPFYDVSERLHRLDEACTIIKALFTQESVNFNGRFYQLKDAPLVPKPLQKNLPLMIGGGGEKLTLKITAKHADEWNVWGTVDILKQKMKILDQHCEKLGRNPRDIKRSAVALMFLSNDENYLKKIREAGGGAQPSIIGNVNEVSDIIGAYKEAGVDELIVPDFTMGPGQQKLDTLDLFITEVAGKGL
ncbi:MAG: TIGR03560 family F420-dependent LLM class oxidoreductase [Gammaproteobacteria bacterium]|nr:TIGR03560 family F420-dependent LLM class oxidoreductase [Gammaproteobacteria bacterium]